MKILEIIDNRIDMSSQEIANPYGDYSYWYLKPKNLKMEDIFLVLNETENERFHLKPKITKDVYGFNILGEKQICFAKFAYEEYDPYDLYPTWKFLSEFVTRFGSCEDHMEIIAYESTYEDAYVDAYVERREEGKEMARRGEVEEGNYQDSDQDSDQDSNQDSDQDSYQGSDEEYYHVKHQIFYQVSDQDSDQVSYIDHYKDNYQDNCIFNHHGIYQEISRGPIQEEAMRQMNGYGMRQDNGYGKQVFNPGCMIWILGNMEWISIDQYESDIILFDTNLLPKSDDDEISIIDDEDLALRWQKEEISSENETESEEDHQKYAKPKNLNYRWKKLTSKWHKEEISSENETESEEDDEIQIIDDEDLALRWQKEEISSENETEFEEDDQKYAKPKNFNYRCEKFSSRWQKEDISSVISEYNNNLNFDSYSNMTMFDEILVKLIKVKLNLMKFLAERRVLTEIDCA